jgi:NADH dehydrogenase
VESHIVILGCGFGGLFAAQALKEAAARVTVIDRANHHLFQPLLYQVATAGLSAPAIAAPIRQILQRQKNATVLMADVQGIDAARRKVVLDGGEEVAYDFLIVATGATHSYFGHPEWERDAPGLKTLEDAFEIRRRILVAYELAEREADSQKRAAWLNFVVIGAGATGVEMAGTLAEIARHTLRGEFRRFDSSQARVILVEGSASVLSTYPPDLSAKARKQLERLGVIVRTDSRVTGIDAEGILIGDERIASKTVIWAAGVAASPLGKSLGVELDRAGRVPVGPDLSIAAHPEVFVIGDLAAATSDGKPVPGISPAAKQMGRYAAKRILRRLRGSQEAFAPFHYKDYGQLATIGRNAAVAILGKLHFSGYPAWLVWLFAHIYFLIGFRNRIVVLFDWALAYWSFERNARIVVGNKDSRFHSKLPS